MVAASTSLLCTACNDYKIETAQSNQYMRVNFMGQPASDTFEAARRNR